jgi:hypothetical protein
MSAAQSSQTQAAFTQRSKSNAKFDYKIGIDQMTLHECMVYMQDFLEGEGMLECIQRPEDFDYDSLSAEAKGQDKRALLYLRGMMDSELRRACEPLTKASDVWRKLVKVHVLELHAPS